MACGQNKRRGRKNQRQDERNNAADARRIDSMRGLRGTKKPGRRLGCRAQLNASHFAD